MCLPKLVIYYFSFFWETSVKFLNLTICNFLLMFIPLTLYFPPQTLTGPIRQLRASKQVVSDLRFMVKHIDRKSNEIIFMKCKDPACTHCSARPVQALKLWQFLKDRDFKWFNPDSSDTHPGHYKTFIEMSEVDAKLLRTGNYSNITV